MEEQVLPLGTADQWRWHLKSSDLLWHRKNLECILTHRPVLLITVKEKCVGDDGQGERLTVHIIKTCDLFFRVLWLSQQIDLQPASPICVSLLHISGPLCFKTENINIRIRSRNVTNAGERSAPQRDFRIKKRKVIRDGVMKKAIIQKINVSPCWNSINIFSSMKTNMHTHIQLNLVSEY